MKVTTTSGYILMLTLMIISLMTIMISRVVNQAMVQRQLSKLFIERQKAKMLAFGGVQIAISQLSFAEEKKPEQKAPPATAAPAGGQKPDDTFKKKFLQQFAVLNRWQTFDFKEDIDGFESALKIYITSEEGKINLNTLYDFDKKSFTVGANKPQSQAAGPQGAAQQPKQQSAATEFDPKKVIQLLGERLKPVLPKLNLLETLEKILRERGKPLYDLSELITNKDFAPFADKLFIQPEAETAEKKIPPLFDLFTIYGEKKELYPVALSHSLATIFGLRQFSTDPEKRTKELEDITKSLPQSTNWSTQWNQLLAPLAGKQYTDIPAELRPLWAPQFDSIFFSVTVYATVGAITEKLCAILEKKEHDKQTVYTIKRIYWI